MSEVSDQVIHPTNPTLLRDVKVPKERGDIRFLHDGSLLYREPIINTEFDSGFEDGSDLVGSASPLIHLSTRSRDYGHNAMPQLFNGSPTAITCLL